jgi:uncharacterized membrane protein YciS (DUF1049 family)
MVILSGAGLISNDLLLLMAGLSLGWLIGVYAGYWEREGLRLQQQARKINAELAELRKAREDLDAV